MNLPLIIYIIDVLSALRNSIGGIEFFVAIASIGSGFAWFMGTVGECSEDTRLGGNKIFIRSVSALIVLNLLSIFIPDKKTMYVIVGTSAAQEIVNNPKVQELGGKVLSVINHKLEELSDQPKPEKK